MLRGPFPVSEVSAHVTRKSPGVYVLSRGRRYAEYVGRSDIDLRGRLLRSIGAYRTHTDRQIKSGVVERWEGSFYADGYFWYQYCRSPRAAFQSECSLYHVYEPSGNSTHPIAPRGVRAKCPVRRCHLRLETQDPTLTIIHRPGRFRQVWHLDEPKAEYVVLERKNGRDRKKRGRNTRRDPSDSSGG